MAKTKADATETTELSAEAQAARAEIGNRPRQSVTRFVELYNIIKETAPDRIEEFFGDQADAIEAVSAEARNPIQDAIDKAAQAQHDMAVKSLTNEDPLNGYAGYVFDAELFAQKTKPKTPRVKKSVAAKVEDLLTNASEEDMQALAALFAAQGI